MWISRQRKWAPILLAIGVIAVWVCIEYVLPRKNPLNPAIPVPHNLNTTFDYGWLRGVAGFSAGMIMYQLYRLSGIDRVMGSDAATVLILLLVAAGLHFAINDVWVVVLFAALVLNFALNNGVLAPGL